MTTEAGREKAAAVGFVAFLGAALGPVGLLVAAVAVGVERAWGGDAGRAHTAERTRQSVADHRAWLARDRARQAAWRQARRDWYRGGADPATRPELPTGAQRAGAGVRRLWARLVVGAADFVAGCRDGWRAGRRVLDEGGTPWDAARARPVDELVELWRGELTDEELDLVARRLCCWAVATKPGGGFRYCGAPVEPGFIYCDPHLDEADREPQPQSDDDGGDRAADSDPTSNAGPETDGDPEMTAPTTTAPAQGETNLQVLLLLLEQIGQHAVAISDSLDAVKSRATQVQSLTTRAEEFAAAKGAPAATRQALDAAKQMVAQLMQHLGGMSEAATAADDEVGQAVAGAKPAIDAEDLLHSSGATGDIVATATADA